MVEVLSNVGDMVEERQQGRSRRCEHGANLAAAVRPLSLLVRTVVLRAYPGRETAAFGMERGTPHRLCGNQT